MPTRYMAIGLAAVVGVVPASFAQAPRVADHGTSAGTAFEAVERQAPQTAADNSGISVDVPIGKVWVGPEFLEGEHIYVRRETARGGIAIVEVSTTPFMAEGPAGAGNLLGRPDQPAPW